MLTEQDRLNFTQELRSSGRKLLRYKRCPLCGGDSNSFVVSERKGSVSCYCFRCNQYVKLSDKTPSYATSLQLSKRSRQQIAWRKNRYANLFTPERKTDYELREVWLPFDCTTELPTKAMLWLLRYNITQQEVFEYAIKWSPQYERLILPVHNDGKLVYWTGRYFGLDANQPKYLNVKQEKGNIIFQAGNGSTKPYLVLVEDILSAIAVQRAGYRTLALLGCHLQDNVLDAMQLQGKQVTVVLWLDQDKMCSSFKQAKRLEVLGWKVKVVVTPLDPKEYTPEKITTFITRRSDYATKNTEGLELCPQSFQDDLELVSGCE